MDYERVNLARKIGGVCDIDQVYILNSNDGPTTGQCGPLTGYSSKCVYEYSILIRYLKRTPYFSAVVAVKPNQEKPLKIAMVVQSKPADYWLIKVSQIACAEIKQFKGREQ